jgi:hypothetical protein
MDDGSRYHMVKILAWRCPTKAGPRIELQKIGLPYNMHEDYYNSRL